MIFIYFIEYIRIFIVFEEKEYHYCSPHQLFQLTANRIFDEVNLKFFKNTL